MKYPGLQGPPSDLRFLNQWLETLEILTGRRIGRVAKLPTTATLTDAIAKVNEIIDRLQGD